MVAEDIIDISLLEKKGREKKSQFDAARKSYLVSTKNVEVLIPCEKV